MNTINTNANLLENCSDELERLALEEVHKRRRSRSTVSALVLPVERSELAIELAAFGCKVTGVDIAQRQQDFLGRALAAGRQEDVCFVPGALDPLPEDIAGAPFDLVFCRRALCTVPYATARRIVRELLLNLKIGGKLYISILGMHSELGDQYPGAEIPIEQRFCHLDPIMAHKYGIHAPVCLYSERNLFMLLLEAGASVLRTFTSTHGSVKGIAVRV